MPLGVRDGYAAMECAVGATKGDQVGLDVVAEEIEIAILFDHGDVESSAKRLVIGFFPQSLQLAPGEGMTDEKHHRARRHR